MPFKQTSLLSEIRSAYMYSNKENKATMAT